MLLLDGIENAAPSEAEKEMKLLWDGTTPWTFRK